MQTINTYPKLEARDLRVIGKRMQGDVDSRLFVVQTPFGYRRTAELLSAQNGESHAAILYVHWYEPESHDSNRSQFVEEAKQLARRGATCLLVETMWSDPDFFLKRTQAEDMQNSVEEVVNLRRFMDLLLSQSNGNVKQFALVGHDFGGMYGVLAGSLDQRPTHYVIMAATPRFSDWYLYAPKLEGDARDAFVRQFARLDPITTVPSLSPAPVFFQFATNDPHVPSERAQEFFDRAREPKDIRWYEAGHGLNDSAAADRMKWLQEKLSL